MKLATRVVLGGVSLLLIGVVAGQELKVRKEITQTLLARYEGRGYNPPPTITQLSRTSLFPTRFRVTILYEHHDYSFDVPADGMGEIPLPIKGS